MTVDARDLYRRWINDIWSADPEKAGEVIDEIVGDDFVGHWPDSQVKGRRALGNAVKDIHSAFDDLTFVITIGPIVDGSLIAGRWAAEGQNSEGPATFFGNDIVRVDDDGVIVEYWTASIHDTSGNQKK